MHGKEEYHVRDSQVSRLARFFCSLCACPFLSVSRETRSPSNRLLSGFFPFPCQSYLFRVHPPLFHGPLPTGRSLMTKMQPSSRSYMYGEGECECTSACECVSVSVCSRCHTQVPDQHIEHDIVRRSFSLFLDLSAFVASKPPTV